MDKEQITIHGLDDVVKSLEELEPRLAKKILKKSLRKILKPLHAEVKSNQPSESGAMKKQVKLRAGKRSRKWISMNVEAKKDESSSWYASFVEMGTKNQDPQDNWLNALNAKRSQIMTSAKTEILKTLDEVVEAERIKNEAKVKA